MTLKTAIVITAVWTVLMVGIGIGAIWYIHNHPIPGVRSEDRAGKLGTGLATLTTIGYACVWLPYAAKVGQQKRAQREKAKRKRRFRS